MKSLSLLILTPLFSFAQVNPTNMNNVLKGTTIITSITSEKIIIAADSKQNWGGDSSHTQAPPLKCKIRHIDNFFFAAEGYTTMIEPHIDFLELIQEMTSLNKMSFIEKVEYIKLNLIESVQQFVENLHKYNSPAFKEVLDKTLFTLVCTTFENQTPKGATIYYNIKSIETGWGIVANSEFIPSFPIYTVQGQKSEVDKQISQGNIYSVKGINELMLAQIKATPYFVGLPIDIVIITTNGYKWVQKKTECE